MRMQSLLHFTVREVRLDFYPIERFGSALLLFDAGQPVQCSTALCTMHSFAIHANLIKIASPLLYEPLAE